MEDDDGIVALVGDVLDEPIGLVGALSCVGVADDKAWRHLRPG